MSASSMRSPRQLGVASYQNSSPRLSSPLNPSPGSFSPSLRGSSIGETSDTVSPLRDHLEWGLISPRPSGVAHPRASSFSRSPDRSPVTGTVPLHPYRSYARHPSPGNSPLAQGIPLSSSSPRPSSPLAGPSQSPGSHNLRPISPPNGSMQGSPASIHSTRSQSQYHSHCSPLHPKPSPSQSSPPQVILSPSSRFTCTQSLIQQSFGSPYTAQASRLDDSLCEHISLSAESRLHSATLVGHSFAQSAQLAVKGDSTPLNGPPLRWWGGRGAWVEDWDHVVQQSQGACDLCTVHTSSGEDLDDITGFLLPVHGTPSSFRESFVRGRGCASMFLDEEIRASFDGTVGIGAGYTSPLEPGFTRTPLDTNTDYEVEGIPVPRTAPVPIPSPVDERFGSQNTSDDLIRRQPRHVHFHGYAGGLPDGSISLLPHEPGHGEQRHEHIRGRNRRPSDASTHTSVSYTSCMSSPLQSQSQSLPVSPSQSHTSTFPSLSSLGIGIEKAEREEFRSRTFWARSRKSSGSTMKRQSKDLSRSPRGHSEDIGHGYQRSPSVRSNENGGLEEGRVGVTKAWEAMERSDVDSKPLSSHTQEKDAARHCPLFFRASPKQVDVLDEQLHRERYERTEKCVSLAITSILPVTTIAMLSPVGEALVKARESVKYIGHELAPVVKDTLSVSTDLLSLAPLPGIEEAAKALLSVWNACQRVDTNRLSCLRLAERCATLLYSVRCEMNEAGMETALALDEPVEKLCGALAQIQTFLEMQLHRPFLKRYVRREEITRELVACNEAITDAGSRFGISVQIRTYHEVCSMMKESKRSSQEVQALLALDHQIMQRYAMVCGQTWGGEVVAGFSSGNALGLTTDGTPPPAYGPQLQLQSTMRGPLSTTSRPISTELASVFDGNSPTPSISSIGHISDGMGVDVSALPAPTPIRATVVAEATKATTTTTETGLLDSILPMHALAQVHRAQDSEDAAADEAALRGTLVGALNAHNDVEMVRCMQVARGEIPEAAETLRRMLGAGPEVGVDRNACPTPDEADHGVDARNTELDREFMQSGIEAMTRLTSVMKLGSEEEGPSESPDGFDAPKLPSWTITRYEVTRTRKIGTGFFSDTYFGHWKKLPVVIKVLARSVSRDAFVRHVELWNALDHPNVLSLYGASSTIGDKPWFFVSKFCGGNDLVASLKRARVEGTMIVGKEGAVCVDLLRSMHEIAKGMAYLHGHGVLHGDLRAANVLVDESGQCVLSDFGQSEIKSEAHRSCGQPEPYLIRWWAPERLSGDRRPTCPADVYAFAICCVEILGMGDLPWTLLDDNAVLELVADKNERPPVPILVGNAEIANAITNLVHLCWDREPDGRPSFAIIASLLEDTCRLPDHRSLWNWEASTPPMNTRSILFTPPTETSPTDESYETASESMTTEVEEESMNCRIDVPLTRSIPVLPTGEVVHSVGQVTVSADVGVKVPRQALCVLEHHDRDTFTPSPTAPLVIDIRNEENYRLILGSNHTFHSSLTLPLWSPTRVQLGAVGYLSKPKGEFISLLNAIDPLQSREESLRRLPSLYGYGKFEIQRREDGKRSVAQRGLDAISGLLAFKTRGDRSYSERIARQYTFPLVQGKPTAYLCVEKAVHRYMDRLEAPTMWFTQHVDLILEVCALRHGIRREDLILVIGTLDALDWAVFVSDDHSDGRAQFNAFATREKGEPWGVYTLERIVKSGDAGPARRVNVGQETFASKVSAVTACAQDAVNDTVMLAGLRFERGMQVPVVM